MFISKKDLIDTNILAPKFLYTGDYIRLYGHLYISYKGFINDCYVLQPTKIVYTDWYGYL